ncbi:MAG: rod shape-determining protein MreC [Flavobacteriaceae bacterium]|nr:rod shape-determining protein MreC [Flavobacteriaceae bacterium]
MRQLFAILYRFRFFIVFFLLESIAMIFTIQNYSYHKSVFVNSTGLVTGSVYNQFISIRDYVHLREENRLLNEENAFLKNQLSAREKVENKIDTTSQKYHYIPARIINNNYNRQHNFLTLNVGQNSGVHPDLGVVNSKGVVGIVRDVSNRFSTVLSILNINSKINVRLKKSSHFGTMIWDGQDYTKTEIIDMPRQASIVKGDTVITSNKSAIFPEGIPIGVIDEVSFEDKQYKKVGVLLFNDMTSINNVQVIYNKDRKEQQEIEQKTENE